MAAIVTYCEQQSKSVRDGRQASPVGYGLMGDERETMAERLARLRAMKGWSLADAAERFGTSRNAVWKWEHGETSHIRYGTLELIAEAYGTDVPYIVWGPDRAPDGSSPRSPPIDRSGRYKKI